MEEALHDIPLYRDFALLDAGVTRLPDESTILRFRTCLRPMNCLSGCWRRSMRSCRQRA
jgi:IS5 family transposase